MTGKIKPIDEMPHLKARLGKARTDRIRYVGQADTSRQKHATNVENTILNEMQSVTPHELGSGVEDILVGIAQSYTDGTKPLSVDRLYNILQCMSLINTREITKMMGIEKRQAQRYLKAVKIALPLVESNLKAETV